MIVSIQDGTGAKVDVGSLNLDWTRLRLTATDLVLHGTEPTGAAPLLRVARVQVDVRLFTSFRRLWDIAYLAVDHPQANIVVYPDGSTNLPVPVRTDTSNRPPLGAAVNLAIGRFEITNGQITLDAQKYPVNVRGTDLITRLSYDGFRREYTGEVSLQPLYIAAGRNTPADLTLRVPLVVGRDRIEIRDGSLTSPQSRLTFSGSLEDLRSPRVLARLQGRLAVGDLSNIASLRLNTKAPGVPSTIEMEASVKAASSTVQIANLRLTMGRSNVEAEGDPTSGLKFKTRLALGELASLSNLSAPLNSVVDISGIGTLNGQHTLDVKGLQVSALGGEFAGEASLQEFTLYAPMSVNASIQNGDVADLLALAGRPMADSSGQLNGVVSVGGTLGNPVGAAMLNVSRGAIHGQVFDRVQLQANLTDQLIAISNASIRLGAAEARLAGSFHHPRNSATTGQMQVSARVDHLDLAQLTILEKRWPNTSGMISLNAEATANLAGELQLSSVRGSFSVSGLRSGGQTYGDLNASASTAGRTVSYSLASNFAGSNINLKGSTELAPEHPTTAMLNLSNLPVQRALAIAGRGDIPVKGALSGSINLTGPLRNPEGTADLTLANGSAYEDAIDALLARMIYRGQRIDSPELEVVAGLSRVNVAAHYDRPTGDMQFSVETNQVNLARVKTITERRPGLAGTVQLTLSGAAQLRSSAPRIQVRTLNGEARTTGLAVHGKNLGDVALSAKTSADRLNVTVGSTLAGAGIRGRGEVHLTRAYPVDVQLDFTNVSWAALSPLLGSDSGGSQTSMPWQTGRSR